MIASTKLIDCMFANSCAIFEQLPSQPNSSSAALPDDIANDPALARIRLPGGVNHDDLVELLLQSSAQAGAQLQIESSEAAWVELTSLAEPYWEKMALRIAVAPVTVPTRPNIIARFLAITDTDNPWLVSGYVAAREGRLVLDQLSVEAEIETPRKGITSTTLREISLPRILAAAEHALTILPDWLELLERHKLGVVPATDHAKAQQAASSTATAGRAKPGRPRRPDELLVWAARTYLALHHAGRQRGILIKLAELATEREGRPITRETVRDWVKAARDRGYLEGRTQGKAGARPGPRLQAITPTDLLDDDRQTSPALRRSSGAAV